jgi:hypothetical protein
VIETKKASRILDAKIVKGASGTDRAREKKSVALESRFFAIEAQAVGVDAEMGQRKFQHQLELGGIIEVVSPCAETAINVQPSLDRQDFPPRSAARAIGPAANTLLKVKEV